jgi:hypothetical protein
VNVDRVVKLEPAYRGKGNQNNKIPVSITQFLNIKD